MFGDTFIGTGPGNIAGLVRNSLVVQDDNCFRPLFGSGGEALPDPQPEHWLWPTAAVAEGNFLRVFALHMQPGGVPAFPFDYFGMSVATFSLPNLNHVSTVPMPVPTEDTLPTYGQTVAVGDDNFVYAYGKTEGTVKHYAARAPIGQILQADQWEVWDGADWSDNPAAPLLFDRDSNNSPTDSEGPIAPFAVGTVPGGYLGSAISFDAFGDQLETWDATAPQGPFTDVDLAVDIWPATDGAPTGRIGYGGRVDLEILGAPIALWSVNEFDTPPPPNLSFYKVMFQTPAPASVP